MPCELVGPLILRLKMLNVVLYVLAVAGATYGGNSAFVGMRLASLSATH